MRLGLAALAGGLALLVAAPGAGAVPVIHAHRGGSVLAGVPSFPENTLSAFRNAAREGYVVELDTKLTADGVPVVIHDATLDRTTNCSGEVAARTLSQLSGCRPDVLGSPGNDLATRRVAPRDKIPTLAETLRLARLEGAFLNLEIKNVPTDSDFDAGTGFADRVLDVLAASGFPRRRVIVQSFWPPNLERTQARLPGVQTSLLTLSSLNSGGPSYAAANGYEWVSPQWPVDRAYVSGAHAQGRRVVPFTLNRANDVRAAAAVGVEALITDDPLMAAQTLGLVRRSQLAPDEIPPRVRMVAPRYASDRSRGTRFRVRWRGRDRGSGIARYTVEMRRNSNVSTRWRAVRRGTRRRSAVVRGRQGVSYLFRVRARDRYGNLSRYGYDETAVPRDERSRHVRFSRGWQRRRARRAYGHSVARGRCRGLRARFVFRGNRVAIIARRLRRGARLIVSIDGRRRKHVSLRGRNRHRRVVYRSRRLRPGRHVLRLRTLTGGIADIDAFGVDTGPPPPRRR